MADLDLRDTQTGNMAPAKGTAGSLHVLDGFKPSNYAGTVVMNGNPISNPIVDAARLRLLSLGTGDMYLTFGTSALNAEANLNHVTDVATTGYYISSSSEFIIGIPRLATHYAVENVTSGQTPSINITQGV